MTPVLLALLVSTAAHAAPIVPSRSAPPPEAEVRPKPARPKPAPQPAAAPAPDAPEAETPPAAATDATPAEPAPPSEEDGVAELGDASDTPPAASDDAEALRAEVLALRAEIGALRAAIQPLTPTDPTAAARASLQADLDAIARQSEQLDAAVAAGLDPGAAAPAREALEQRRSDTEAALAELDGAAPSGIAWTLDAGVATAYAFRGLNVFQSAGQADAHALLAPSVTAALGDSGVSVGWWGAYQLSGPNAADLVDSGLGAETDLFATWTTKPAENVAVSATFTSYLYPLASPEAAGTAFPVYLEPSARITWSSSVDLGFSAAYMHGVQDALAPWRYVYLRPTVSRNVSLPANFTLGLGVGAGWKGSVGPVAATENIWDANVDVSITKQFEGGFYLTPSAHAVWTDLGDTSFADEAFGWFGLNAGVAL